MLRPTIGSISVQATQANTQLLCCETKDALHAVLAALAAEGILMLWLRASDGTRGPRLPAAPCIIARLDEAPPLPSRRFRLEPGVRGVRATVGQCSLACGTWLPSIDPNARPRRHYLAFESCASDPLSPCATWYTSPVTMGRERSRWRSGHDACFGQMLVHTRG